MTFSERLTRTNAWNSTDAVCAYLDQCVGGIHDALEHELPAVQAGEVLVTEDGALLGTLIAGTAPVAGLTRAANRRGCQKSCL